MSRCAVLGALIWLLSVSGSAQVALSVGSGAATPGGTVVVPISASIQQGQAAALQWTVTYAPTVFSSASLATGTAAEVAGKAIECLTVSAGSIKCIVWGLNAQPIPGGVIAVLSLTVSASAAPSSASVAVSDLFGATPTGSAVTVTSAPGTVVVNPSMPGIKNLSCTFATLAVGGSTACSVTLGEAAPSSGARVDLGVVATGGAVVDIPQSVTVPVGSTTATFNAVATTGSGAGTVVITATLGGTILTWTISIQGGVAVSVSPASVSLGAGQSVQLAASVSGTENTAVSWSRSPAIGTVSASGLFTAPASLSTPVRVIVTATSAADSTKRATASISLVPGVSISLSPATVSLAARQTMQFQATVSGTVNRRVRWSLSPALGSISSWGLYRAPAWIRRPTLVTITATSLADPTKKAIATVTLSPAVSASLLPSKVRVTSRQTVHFQPISREERTRLFLGL